MDGHTVSRSVRTTLRVEQRLQLVACSIPSEMKARGVYYRHDCDEAALNEARQFHNDSTQILRARAKQPDLAVALMIDRRGEELWAVCEATVTTRS